MGEGLREGGEDDEGFEGKPGAVGGVESKMGVFVFITKRRTSGKFSKREEASGGDFPREEDLGGGGEGVGGGEGGEDGFEVVFDVCVEGVSFLMEGGRGGGG